ncbi:MAG: hypothetical protein ACTHL3_07255 [Candidatus Nitrosocosmicus sp.]
MKPSLGNFIPNTLTVSSSELEKWSIVFQLSLIILLTFGET